MLTNPETGRYEPTREEIDRAWRENRGQWPGGPSRRVLAPGEKPTAGEPFVEVIEVPLPTVDKVEQGTVDIGERVQSELEK